MSTLYRPVKIDTAEQAENLPVGTLAVSSEDYDDGTVMHWAAVKVSDVWARTDVSDGLPMTIDAAMVDADTPWTALVPIEVDEEILTNDTFASSEQLRRFTTPWQRFPTPKETP